MMSFYIILFLVYGAIVTADESNITRTDSEENFYFYTYSSADDKGCSEKIECSTTTWRCNGIDEVPLNLTLKTDEMVLSVINSGIEVLRGENLAPYANFLNGLNLNNVQKFHTLEPGIFDKTKKLRWIYINGARNLTHIDDKVFQVDLPELSSIRITNGGLLTTPYLGNLSSHPTMTMMMVNFENNNITSIGTGRIIINVKQLIFSFNKIKSVDSGAFNGSQIEMLRLKGNRELETIHPDAFLGISNMKTLDLSSTSITSLPTKGLEKLENLLMNDTASLRKFPSVYKFESIVRADLTYPYHCCAFKYPAKHDPETYEKLKKNRNEEKDDCDLDIDPEVKEFYKENSKEFEKLKEKYCRKIVGTFKNITCYPKPDAFSPCEDIMGNSWLRVAVWFVAILAILGNLVVLTVLVSSKLPMTVPKFIMCNLAFSDLCMGVYLTMIASVDARSIGVYFNEAIDWQSGLGCKVAGVLTVFSTELSVFTLMVLTSERWYTITYAIQLDRRLELKTAVKIMAVGWFYAGLMSVLPLTGISSYTKTSLCLPLDDDDTGDLIYLGLLLVFNCFAFIVIVVCYGYMYASVKGGPELGRSSTARSDAKIARKMALLVFVDFACWAPIAFFGVTALAGRPLIDLTLTKYLLVFFYPLNSFANPYLYAILTRQYRQDALLLLARLGVCKERAARSRGAKNFSVAKSKRPGSRNSANPETEESQPPSSPLRLTGGFNLESSSAKNCVSSDDAKKFEIKDGNRSREEGLTNEQGSRTGTSSA